MKMKLGVMYNVFDGEENLPMSVESIRGVADVIGVVYQDESNFGERRDLVPLKRMLNELGIKIKVYYERRGKVGAAAEAEKRNLGLNTAKLHGCTHFMTMDCDEVYDPKQIAMVKDDVEANDWHSTACQMLTYYKRPNIVLDPPEEYYVPLIYRLDGRRFGGGHQPFPVSADPTRRLATSGDSRYRLYTRDEIQMHHYSMIRNDIRKKLRNSSAVVNFADRVEDIAHYYDEYVEGQPAYWPGSEVRMLPVKVL